MASSNSAEIATAVVHSEKARLACAFRSRSHTNECTAARVQIS